MKKQKEAKNNTKSQLLISSSENKVPYYERAWLILQKLSVSRPFFFFCALLLPFIALANFPTCLTLLYDNDIWFHLAYGREYIQNMTWNIDHSQFSWTPARSEWLYGTWLGSSLMYVIHELGGIHGLFTFHHMIIVAAAGATLWLAYFSGMRIGIGLLTALLATAHILSFSAMYIKPEMFSILLVTLTAVACLRFRIAPGLWILAVLPAIFIFWVNLHGLWFFGLAFLLLFLFASLFEFFYLPHKELDKKAVILLSSATGMAILALVVNPDGVFYPASVASGMIISDNTDMFREIIAYDSMWKHLFGYKGFTWTLAGWILITTFFAFIWVWLKTWKKTGKADLPVAATNIVFFLMGMYMARLSLVYAMIWLPSICYMTWRLGPRPAYSRSGPLLVGAFLLLTIISVAKVTFLYEDRTWLGFGHLDYVTESEVAFIMDNNLKGPIFNDYVSGGYMMWRMYPSYKVFIDPRQAPYFDQVFPDWVGIGTKFPLNNQGLNSFLTEYPARIALIRHNRSDIIEWFMNSPDWSLAYFDKNASVLLHRDVGTRLSPETRAISLSPERYENVTNPRILRQLFAYYHLFGPRFSSRIRDYYETNVWSLYIDKKYTLATMDDMLSGKIQQQEGN